MSQLVLMIARIDDLDNPEMLTEVWRRAMPVVEASGITPEHHLDGLENDVTEVGWEAMRHLLVEQWRLTDEMLVARFRQEQSGVTLGDGYDALKVASRWGVVPLPRQVCYLPGADRHTLPGNAGLPVHAGQVTTRGLHFSNTDQKVVSGHCLMTGLYVLLGRRCPLQAHLYRQPVYWRLP